jgi:magnesium transporter
MNPQLQRHLDTPVRQFARPTAAVLKETMTVAEAAALLRQRTIQERIVYFYVVDENDRLTGVLPSRKLILAALEEKIGDLMYQSPVACPAETPLREALAMFARHQFLALPVVDDAHRLVGVIDLDLYSEEAVDRAVADRESDVFQLIGVWIEQYRAGGAIRAYRMRMPWLICNMVGGMVCAGIATWFGAVIELVLVIAAFVPLVLTLSESISIQSLTLSLQSLHTSTTDWRQLARLIWREGRTSFLLGLTCAIVVGAMAFIWGGGIGVPLVIASSILAAMCLAALLGMGIPLTLHLLRLDPRVAAGPVVLMCVDVATLIIYLAIASAALV